jgi:DNA polymerase III delta prime subunit
MMSGGGMLERYHIAYLYSAPLTGQLGGHNSSFKINQLDCMGEKKILFEQLQESGRGFHVVTDVSTTDNLRKYTTLGCRALHYTGHGLSHCLVFEDNCGSMHAVSADSLRKLVVAGQGAQGLQFVFVSACHSEQAGKSFVEAGVKHVIAVKKEAQVTDQASQIFTKNFYLSLLVGHTVQDAFDTAQAAVKSHHTTKRMNENKKFLLLPLNGDHNVTIFPRGDENVREGKWQDFSMPERPNNLPHIPLKYDGRNFKQQECLEELQKKKHRFLTLYGEQGIGKTTLATAVARYVWQRHMYDGVFFVYFENLLEICREEGLEGEAMDAKSSAGGLSILRLFNDIHRLKVDCNEGRDFKSTSDFFMQIHDKNYLFVLDRVGVCKHAQPNSPLCVRYFLSKLFFSTRHIKVIATSLQPVGKVKNSPERLVQVTKLTPLDAAQLFYNLSPRRLEPAEFDCVDADNAQRDLAAHAVLQMLDGHPRKIFNASQLLVQDRKLNDLPALIRELWQERKQEQDADFEIMSQLSLRRSSSFINGRPTPSPSTPSPSSAAWDSRGLSQRSKSFGNPGNSSPVGESLDGKDAAPPSYALAINVEGEEENFGDVVKSKEKFPLGAEQKWIDWFGTIDGPQDWEDLSAHLSEYFATHSTASKRSLGESDLNCMKPKLADHNASVAYGRFEGFWSWFVAFIRVIRRVPELWLTAEPAAFLKGVMSRAECNRMLSGKNAGTFLLRLSESQAGCIAVAFVDSNLAPGHILIDCKSEQFRIFLADGQDLQYSSLVELVLNCKKFTHFHSHTMPDGVHKSAFR